MSSARKQLVPAYGFDDVAIAPGRITVNPELVDLSVGIDSLSLDIPVLASAMDAVVSPAFAIKLSEFGGLGVLNLDGLQTRYEDPSSIFLEIAESPEENVTALLQKAYTAPVKQDLIGHRVEQIKRARARCAVSVIPANAKRHAPVAVEAGTDVLVVQSTVTTARHHSRSTRGLIFSELVKEIGIPVIVGNTVSYDVALEIMEE